MLRYVTSKGDSRYLFCTLYSLLFYISVDFFCYHSIRYIVFLFTTCMEANFALMSNYFNPDFFSIVSFKVIFFILPCFDIITSLNLRSWTDKHAFQTLYRFFLTSLKNNLKVTTIRAALINIVFNEIIRFLYQKFVIYLLNGFSLLD